MANRAGPRSGATSSWGRFSTLPDSASAPPTNTARPYKPTTTPRAPWMKPASICKKHSNARKTDKRLVRPDVILRAAIASLGEAIAESKDPYKRITARCGRERAGFVALPSRAGKYQPRQIRRAGKVGTLRL